MPKRSALDDIVSSATAAKVHFEVWWAQASEAKPRLIRQLNKHSDFFRASYDAHYVAYHVYVAHLFDTTRRTASIGAYLKEIKAHTPAGEYKCLVDEYKSLQTRAKTLIMVRNKTVAHIDQLLTEKEIFGQVSPKTYNQTRELIYEIAQFVAKLASRGQQRAAVGMPRDRRLSEATLALIRAIT